MNKIEEIELSKIDSFKNHPFKVNNDESLKELPKSIKENGLLNPLLVRKKENGRYELISGHRRKLAMENMGLTKANAIVWIVNSLLDKLNVDRFILHRS